MIPSVRAALLLLWSLSAAALSLVAQDDKVVRVFIFAGQSNMVGADSKVKDVARFPPFVGLEKPQAKVRFAYCIGRKNKKRSDGWTELQPVDNMVGPELSFAREVTGATKAPVAIIKVAAGGTTIGADWNPAAPEGFKLYPLLLETVRDSLALLDKQRVKWRLEGFVWHQGENDMFNDGFRKNYGANLANFIQNVRKDLETPKLPFYIGELCTKTIWGMDLRPRMYEISVGQRAVTAADPLATYVETSHVGVEIGGGVGLHYHYGTLGQLEHGVNYAAAYLKSIGKHEVTTRPLTKWPYAAGSTVDLFVMAGHRNMEGERAFAQELATLEGKRALRADEPRIAYRYSLGGGVKVSDGWEPLGLAGYYDTFGPEVSFGKRLLQSGHKNVAIAKFTHSGSQIVDWTKEGSVAKSRNLFPQFVRFVRESVASLEKRGHKVRLRICYHVGENDMSWFPFRRDAAKRLQSVIADVRAELNMPSLVWIVSQQDPTDHKNVNRCDPLADVAAFAKGDQFMVHLTGLDLPEQEKQLVLDTAGVVRLGEILADAVTR